MAEKEKHDEAAGEVNGEKGLVRSNLEGTPISAQIAAQTSKSKAMIRRWKTFWRIRK